MTHECHDDLLKTKQYTLFILLCSQATNGHTLRYTFHHSVLLFDLRLLKIPNLHSLIFIRHSNVRMYHSLLFPTQKWGSYP
jgi:hypothetical protein